MTSKDLEFVILAAGKSTRNYPHSKGIPHKCLMPFGSVKIIDYIVNQIVQAGGKFITVVVPDEVSINYFKDCFKKEPEIEVKFEKKGRVSSLELLRQVYIPDDVEIRYQIQKQPKGTGHAVAMVYNEIKDTGRRIVMIWPDDIIISKDVPIYKRVVEKYISMGGVGNLGLTRKVDDPSRWGIVDNGYFKEKPKESSSNEAAFGLFVFDKKVLEKLYNAAIKMETGEIVDGVVDNELAFADALNKTIDEDPQNQKIQTICMNDGDKYFDCGCIEGYEKALLYTILYQSKFKEENKKFLNEIL